MRLRAIYRFTISGEQDDLKQMLKVLVAAWRLLRRLDRHATFRLEQEDEDAPADH